jgi:hypothetical protein
LWIIDHHLDRRGGGFIAATHSGFKEAVLKGYSASHHVLELHAIEKPGIVSNPNLCPITIL